MTLGRLHTDDLDDFVAECDRHGGFVQAEAAGAVREFTLSFSTEVDDELDGYSEEYCRMQLELYREISGRDLDQYANEVHVPIDVDGHVDAPNPYASANVDLMAKHARTILTAVVVSDLPPAAKVLDVGCGWGVSTEMLAWTGCDVTAVDIDPQFIELVTRRAEARNNLVTTARSSFDDFDTEDRFDLVLFYECLHHAVRPWEIAAKFGAFLEPGGKLTLAGEPIQDRWWKTWGLRLDPMSIYCIRKYGWFESGWSASFITDCFERAGFELTILEGLGILHSPIAVAVRHADDVATPTAHWVVPPVPLPVEVPRSKPRAVAGRVARRFRRGPVDAG